jgi:hypothetical protein
MGLNIELLESSFELLEPQAETLVSRFYDRLLDKHPAVKPMFVRTTMTEQKKKLLASHVLVMQNLRRPDSLGPALKQLGARHVAYGTQPAYYIQRCSGNFVWASWRTWPGLPGLPMSSQPGPRHSTPLHKSCWRAPVMRPRVQYQSKEE